MFEIAVVNESSVFEPLRFYCINFSVKHVTVSREVLLPDFQLLAHPFWRI